MVQWLSLENSLVGKERMRLGGVGPGRVPLACGN